MGITHPILHGNLKLASMERARKLMKGLVPWRAWHGCAATQHTTTMDFRYEFVQHVNSDLMVKSVQIRIDMLDKTLTVILK